MFSKRVAQSVGGETIIGHQLVDTPTFYLGGTLVNVWDNELVARRLEEEGRVLIVGYEHNVDDMNRLGQLTRLDGYSRLEQETTGDGPRLAFWRLTSEKPESVAAGARSDLER